MLVSSFLRRTLRVPEELLAKSLENSIEMKELWKQDGKEK